MTGWDHGLSAEELLGDRRELMRAVRTRYLGAESSLSADERTSVVRITSIAEHVFLLLTRLACEYELFATEGACFQRAESRGLNEHAPLAVEAAGSAGVSAMGAAAAAPEGSRRSFSGAPSR